MPKNNVISDISPRKQSRMNAKPKKRSTTSRVLVKDENEKNTIYHGVNHGVSFTPSKIEVMAHKMMQTMEQPLIYDTTFRHRPLRDTVKTKSVVRPALIFGLAWSLFVVAVALLILARISK
jgi:hypothetical protein